jgi:hypothetical protein
VSRHSFRSDRWARPRRGRAGPLRLSLLGAALLLVAPTTHARAADRTRISALADVNFGVITNFGADLVRSQSVCVYSKAPPLDQYRITATGSGSGGAFELSSGSDTLPYEVEWSASAGQSNGTSLVANQALAAQQTTAAADDCSRGPATTASLVVVLRSANLATATSGNYTGTLTLVVAAE